jgi:general stress protein 26
MFLSGRLQPQVAVSLPPQHGEQKTGCPRSCDAAASPGPAQQFQEIDMAEDVARAWEMMEKLSTAMVVSRDGEGMHSRPLAGIVRRDEGKVYFISTSDSPQIDAIAAGSPLMLNFSNGTSQFLAAEADALVSTDRALIKALWNPGAQSFWPEGPETADVTVIAATPTSAEYWDGPSGVVAVAKIAFALATGSRPDMGENRTVSMQS